MKPLFRLLISLPLLVAVFSSPSFAEDLTRLRAGRPTGTFRTRSGSTELRSAQVKVRNVGTIEAKDIVVTVVVPSGRTGRIYGPNTLGPNKSAIYSSDSVFIPITKGGKLKTKVSCSNCRS